MNTSENPVVPEKNGTPGQVLFSGVATALITPFTENGAAIDFPALEKLIAYQCDGGADALIVAGTTGEASTLSEEEYLSLLRYTVEAVGHRVPVIAGCGSNDTARAVAHARTAAGAECDALLAVTPYYNKATAEGLYRHFCAIADATPLPILLYNVPGRTGCDLTPKVVGRLCAHPRIAGIKEASCSILRIAELLEAYGDRLAVYSGCDELYLPTLSLSGSGVISVVSNLLPTQMHALFSTFRAGQTTEAASMQLALLPLIRALFAEVNPIPVKTALSLMGFCRPDCRLPLCTASPQVRRDLETRLAAYGLC